jgi:colicin import membrane protein
LAKEDAKRFQEKKVSHNQLTNAAKREADAKEAAVKAQEKLLDYTAGPEELLKQFSSKQGGAVEIGIKKGEISKEKEAADKELAAAKTGAEKKAAAEKIEAAEAKIKALDEALALAKQRAGTATSKPAAAAAGADNTKKSIEAAAEQKKTEEAAAKTAEEAKKKADEEAAKKKEDAAKKPESLESLIAQLNTNMAQLLATSKQTTTNTYEQVMATKGLTKDLFKSM